MKSKPTLAALLLAVSMLGACGSADQPAAIPDDSTGSTTTPPDDPQPVEPTRVLIRPENDADIQRIAAELGGNIVKKVEGTRIYVVDLPPQTDLESALDNLKADVRVLNSETDRKVSSPEGGGATIPIGGEFFAFQIQNQIEFTRIGVNQARARASGQNVRIAVIDSGVVATHQALAGRIESGGWDFVDGDGDPTDEANGEDDDGDGLIDEGWGHGTFISSIILAIAPNAMIRPYRVLDSDSNGVASQVAEAIVLATNSGVNAINLSLGMESGVYVVREAIEHAKANGVPVIVSAGNTGQEDVTFPASISAAFAVTAVDPQDVLAPFASYGSDVDIAAPGATLIGAYPTAPDAAVMWPGTSFSAAIVSGTFALMRELFPLATAEALLQHMATQSLDVDDLNEGMPHEGKMGEGRLDMDAATQGP